MSVPRVHFSLDGLSSTSCSEEEIEMATIGSLIGVHKRNSVKFPSVSIVQGVLELINSIHSSLSAASEKPKFVGLFKKLKIDESGSEIGKIQIALDQYTKKSGLLGLSTKKPFYSERILQRHEMERVSTLIDRLSHEKMSDEWCYISSKKLKLPIEVIYNTYKNKFYCIPLTERLNTSGLCMALLIKKQTDTWTASRVWCLTHASLKNIHEIVVSPLFPILLDQFKKYAIYDYTLWPISSLTSLLNSISLKNKIVIAAHIAEVIGALHRKGYAHRNITSSTISIASDGQCCFAGLDETPSKLEEHCLASVIDKNYLSLRGLEVSPKHKFSIDELKQEDVFALGCVFYTLLTQSALPWEEEEVVPLTSFSAEIFDSEKTVDLEYKNKIKELLRQDRKRSAEAAKKNLESHSISEDSFRNLVYWMLHPQASERPTIETVESYLTLCHGYIVRK